MNLPDYENAIHFSKWKDKNGNPQNADFTASDETSLGTIYLTGGGFVDRAFKGTGVDSKYGWQEFTWKKSPSRGSDFAFSNMDSIDVGLVARCEISYKYMNIQDYMDLRKIVGRERHFYAKFFDIDSGEWTKREVYCSENERTKLFTLGQALIGVTDLTVKLVGTNNDVATAELKVTYYNGDSAIDSLAQSGLSEGDQITIGTYEDSSSGTLKGWTTTSGSSTINYEPNQSTTLWTDLKLYAVFYSDEEQSKDDEYDF